MIHRCKLLSVPIIIWDLCRAYTCTQYQEPLILPFSSREFLTYLHIEMSPHLIDFRRKNNYFAHQCAQLFYTLVWIKNRKKEENERKRRHTGSPSRLWALSPGVYLRLPDCCFQTIVFLYRPISRSTRPEPKWSHQCLLGVDSPWWVSLDPSLPLLRWLPALGSAPGHSLWGAVNLASGKDSP